MNNTKQNIAIEHSQKQFSAMRFTREHLTITMLDTIHRPVFYLKLNSTL
jgi:hypothetical protein